MVGATGTKPCKRHTKNQLLYTHPHPTLRQVLLSNPDPQPLLQLSNDEICIDIPSVALEIAQTEDSQSSVYSCVHC